MPIPVAMPVAEAPTASQVPAVSPSAPMKVVGWQLGVENFCGGCWSDCWRFQDHVGDLERGSLVWTFDRYYSARWMVRRENVCETPSFRCQSGGGLVLMLVGVVPSTFWVVWVRVIASR